MRHGTRLRRLYCVLRGLVRRDWETWQDGPVVYDRSSGEIREIRVRGRVFTLDAEAPF